MTEIDINWFWSTGVYQALEYVGTKPWPNASIDSPNTITAFKLTDSRYLLNADFRRYIDIINEAPHWDVMRGINFLLYNIGVRYDYPHLPNLYVAMLGKIRYLMGSLPQPNSFNIVEDSTFDAWINNYVVSPANLSRASLAASFNDLHDSKYIQSLRYSFINGYADSNNSLPGLPSLNDWSAPGAVAQNGIIVMFGICYGILSLVLPPKGEADSVARILGCFYLAWGVAVCFPPLVDIIEWCWKLIVAIFKGNLLQFILESIFYLIGKVLEMILYLLLKLMEFIMWIPFIGWPFIPFYYALKAALFPGNTDDSNPDGTKLMWYGAAALGASLLTSYLTEAIVVDNYLYGLILVAPSLALCFIYISVWGTTF